MNQRRERRDEAARVSLLSIPVRRIRPHFWTFSVCFVATLIFNICIYVIAAENPSWRQGPMTVMRDTTFAAGFWMLFSPILVEGAFMVFAAMFREKTREEGREEGLEEGREEGRAEGREEGVAKGHTEADAAWREWNARRLAAEADAQPFSEPPPDFRNGSPGDDE